LQLLDTEWCESKIKDSPLHGTMDPTEHIGVKLSARLRTLEYANENERTNEFKPMPTIDRDQRFLTIAIQPSVKPIAIFV